MLKYEYSAFLQFRILGTRSKHGIRYLPEVRQGVWWVSKYNIVFPPATFQETEHVTTYQGAVFLPYLLKTLANERGMVTIQLHARHVAASAAEHLYRYASRACKEVEGRYSLKVDVAVQHVKDILLCKVRGRTCLERPWNIEMPSFVFSRYYSHNYEQLLDYSTFASLRLVQLQTVVRF